MLTDVRVGVRSLRRTPGFALTAILTLALGIGLATAVFTVADALLLRRLPVQDQDRVVVLWGQKSDQDFAYPLGFDDAREFAQRTRSFERVSTFASWGAAPLPIRDRDQISTCAARSFRARSSTCSACDPCSVARCSSLMMCTGRHR